MAKLTQVTINGDVIPASEIMYWHVDDVHADAADAFELRLRPTVKNYLTDELTVQQEVIIQEGYVLGTETYRMRGRISLITDKPGEIILTGEDKLANAIAEQINKVYISATDPTAGIASEIVKDIFTTCGISYTTASVIDSTPFQPTLIGEFVCRDADPLERLATLAVSCGFAVKYRSTTDLGYFQPKGYTSNSNPLYIGGASNMVTNQPEWIFDGYDQFNWAKVDGALDLYDQPPQLFNGNGSTTVFTLSGKNAETVKVEYDAAGGTNYTVKTGGKDGSSLTYDYTFNKETNKVTFYLGNATPTAPASGTNNIRITPTAGEPTPVIVENVASQALYNRVIKKKLSFTDITNAIDVETRAQGIVDAYAFEFASTTVQVQPSVVEAKGYEAGQLIMVTDATNSKVGTREVVIRRVRRFYPEKALEVEIGDKEYKTYNLEYDTQLRLKRLEEKLAGTQDIVTVLKRLEFNIQPFVSEMLTQSYYIADTPYTGHEYNSISSNGTIIDSFETMPLLPSQKLFLDMKKNPNSNIVSDLSAAGNNGTLNITATAYFPFNGNANDDSINANNGTVSGATLTTDEFGNANNAYNFANKNQYISIGTHSSLNVTSAITMIFRAKYVSGGDANTYYLFASRDGTNGAISFALDNAEKKLKSYIGTTEQERSSVVSIDDGAYHTYGLVYSGTSIVYYLDGVAITTDSTLSGTINNTVDKRIGARAVADDFSWVGDISQVLIRNGVALNATEMLNAHNVMSSHKLDKPTITVTDSDGVTITGHEFFYSQVKVNGQNVNTIYQENDEISIYFELMARSTSNYSNQYIFNSSSGGSNRFYIRQESNGKIQQNLTDSGTVDIITPSNAQKVNKILITVDSALSAKTYVNGTLVASQTLTNSTFGPDTITYGGVDSTDGKNVCIVSKPIIFNRVLTATERALISAGAIYSRVSDKSASSIIVASTFGGSATDTSSTAATMTVSGATLAADKFSTSNHCYLFDGVNDEITMPDVAAYDVNSSEGITMVADIKTSQSTTGTIFGNFNSSTGLEGYGMEVSGDKLRVCLSSNKSNDYFISSNTSINDNAWHTVAFGLNKYGQGYIMIDGVVDKTFTHDMPINSSLTFRIGANSAGSGYFSGYIDNPIVVKEYMTPGQMYDNYQWRTLATITDYNNLTYGLSIHLNKELQLDWDKTGTQAFTIEQSYGDLSTYTGAASGTPVQGTIGMWVTLDAAADISAIKVRIGSSNANYAECTGRAYASDASYGSETATFRKGRNYVLFDLDTATIVGTPNWTAVVYAQIEVTTVTAVGRLLLDLWSISKSNYVGDCPTVTWDDLRAIVGNGVTTTYTAP